MDDYELQQVLESMAHAADIPAEASATSEDISQTALRWQQLFNLTQDDAIDRILRHRNDLSRSTISDHHWATIRADKEKAGYDREAYEYELNLEKSKVVLANLLPTGGEVHESPLRYLLQLTGPLEDMQTVRFIAGLDHDPTVVVGSSVETWESVRLCCIDAKAKARILEWSASAGIEPTILVDPRSMHST